MIRVLNEKKVKKKVQNVYVSGFHGNQSSNTIANLEKAYIHRTKWTTNTNIHTLVDVAKKHR